MMDLNTHIDWLKIEEMFKYIKSQHKEVIVSPVVYKALENSKMELFGVTKRSSPLFPFEKHWDACDIDTHRQIQIPSGVWIHGVMMPPIPDYTNMGPLSLGLAPEIIEEDRRNELFIFKA